MKTLFLGPFAARVAPTILAKMTEKIDHDTLADESDTQRLIPLLGEAEIVVGHIWKKGFPKAPRLKFIQSTAAGLDLIDLPVDVVVVLEQQERAGQGERVARSPRERGWSAPWEHVFVKIGALADGSIRTYVRLLG